MRPEHRATELFRSCFGSTADELFMAPGRVNLIGEHTDYNDGFVLPTAIEYGTALAIRKRQDDTVRVIASDFGEELATFQISDAIPSDPELPWSNYIRGVIQTLSLMGHSISGADMVIAGDVPRGVGLSSSASLEVVVGFAFAQCNQLSLSPTEIALIGQRAENEYVGCNCGIMDQLISAAGKEGHALLIDCRSLETEAIPIPEGLAVVIVDSGVERQLVGSAYNDRRLQCEKGAELLGVSALRDATLEQLEAESGSWDPVIRRRSRHVISENQRTLDATEALRSGDIQAMRALMAGSHQSLKNDFEVTVPAIDFLVDTIGEALGDKGGVRMTGGGFGGCVVALTPPDRVDALRNALQGTYTNKTGNHARVFVCRPSAGAGIIAL